MGRAGVMLKTREYDIMSLLFRREVVEFLERSQCTQPFWAGGGHLEFEHSIYSYLQYCGSKIDIRN